MTMTSNTHAHAQTRMYRLNTKKGKEKQATNQPLYARHNAATMCERVYFITENSWCGTLLGKRKCAIRKTKYPEKLEN